MLTMKQQLIQELQTLEENQILVTIETLSTGDYNEMTWIMSKDKIIHEIENGFNEFLQGKISTGQLTTIEGWRFQLNEEIDLIIE